VFKTRKLTVCPSAFSAGQGGDNPLQDLGDWGFRRFFGRENTVVFLAPYSALLDVIFAFVVSHKAFIQHAVGVDAKPIRWHAAALDTPALPLE